MGSLVRFSQLVERRLGTTGLAIIAGLIFFGAVTGAASGIGGRPDSALRSAPVALGGGADSTSSSSSSSSTTEIPTSTTAVSSTSTTVRNGLDGFQSVSFTVMPKGQPAKNFCGLLAATSEQQAKGLMGRTDLGGYDAMLFPFANDTKAAFYMANVPAPLSVAWFKASGAFVSSADMEVCTVVAADCPRYTATAAFRTAVETFKGGLDGLGITSGSTLSVGATGPC